MAQVIDTRAAGRRDPVAWWRGEASRAFQPLDVSAADPSAFWAHSVAYALHDVTLTHTRSQASVVDRDEAAIALADPGLLMLVLHVQGRYELTHAGTRAVCTAGDLALLDSSLPFSARSDGPIDVVTVALPKDALAPGAAPRPRIPGDAGAAVLVRGFLGTLLDGLEEGTIDPGDAAVAGCLVGLVGSLVRDAGGAAPLQAVKRWIDEHLADADLSPGRIATANHMSRRRLYTLFEEESCGVREWIRARRLERCRRDLRDPALRHETVMTIALRWGFVDASHFSHCFREAYGCSPRTYRTGT
jgi:AraC-like DNA-binding protein